MKRRSFLTRLAAGLGLGAALPAALAEPRRGRLLLDAQEDWQRRMPEGETFTVPTADFVDVPGGSSTTGGNRLVPLHDEPGDFAALRRDLEPLALFPVNPYTSL